MHPLWHGTSTSCLVDWQMSVWAGYLGYYLSSLYSLPNISNSYFFHLFQQAFCMQNVTLFSSVSVQGFFSKHMWESLHTKWSLKFTTCCSHWPWHPALICGSILSLIIEYISTWVHRALSALFPLAEEGIHPQIYIPSSHNRFAAFVDC